MEQRCLGFFAFSIFLVQSFIFSVFIYRGLIPFPLYYSELLSLFLRFCLLYMCHCVEHLVSIFFSDSRSWHLLQGPPLLLGKTRIVSSSNNFLPNEFSLPNPRGSSGVILAELRGWEQTDKGQVRKPSSLPLKISVENVPPISPSSQNHGHMNSALVFQVQLGTTLAQIRQATALMLKAGEGSDQADPAALTTQCFYLENKVNLVSLTKSGFLTASLQISLLQIDS